MYVLELFTIFVGRKDLGYFPCPQVKNDAPDAAEEIVDAEPVSLADEEVEYGEGDMPVENLFEQLGIAKGSGEQKYGSLLPVHSP